MNCTSVVIFTFSVPYFVLLQHEAYENLESLVEDSLTQRIMLLSSSTDAKQKADLSRLLSRYKNTCACTVKPLVSAGCKS